MTDRDLLQAARRAADAAYARYSGFRVGAAVRCGDGRIVTGCNIENASYGLSICAERVAVFAAVAAGARRLQALALSCPDAPPRQPIVPCGACCQVLTEFADPGLAILVEGRDPTTLAALFPEPFRLA